MSGNNRENIHVSRHALTEFGWSAPMRDLAGKVGMSDVGLRKLLKSHDIVTPPQGHWNRVHAGRRVPPPPTVQPRRPGETGRITLDHRFRGLIPETPALPVGGPFASPAVPEDLEELRAQTLKAIGKVAAPRSLEHPHPALQRLLEQQAQKREKVAARGWHWDEPIFDTPSDQRKLRLLNGLFHALARAGHSGSTWEKDMDIAARCHIGDMELFISFAIVGKHRTEMIRGQHRPARDLPATTPLRLQLRRDLRCGTRTSWADTDPEGKLESRLTAIAADVIVAGEAAFRQSLVEAVEWEEQQRRWAEERRLERLAQLEARRLEDLRKSGSLLAHAEEVRALVARVGSVMSAAGAGVTEERLAGWRDWALRYADRLDPVLSGQVLSHIHVPELDDPDPSSE